MWGVALAAGLSGAAMAQTDKGPEAAARHNAAAAQAAGDQFATLKRVACAEREPPTAPAAAAAAARGAQPAGARGRGAQAPAARTAPARDTWIADPVKVFDNLYFVGTREHGAWAITTSAGIILIDALYDYAVIDAVEGGLKKLGLDPRAIKYLIVTHGHGDHHGGTKYLQDKYRPTVVMGARDWDLVERDTRSPRPARGVEAADGQRITLGGQTVTLYVTPGHTPTTLSLIVPVTDNGTPHVAAEWGGTALNANTPAASVQAYLESAVRFRRLAADAGADVLIANHTVFDGTRAKLAALPGRKPEGPHPFVVGPQVVDRYMTVIEECGRALLAAR
jgi:metallo-beta-lactamase class B